MAKYDFSTLTDKEFEELTCDLMNEEYSLRLQSFKTGKDKGVDLRYSTADKTNAIVVQAKQYHTNYRALYNNLKREEVKKVRALAPNQYWLVTSLPLSAVQKDSICLLFKPYMADANYVLGQDDLNRLLRRHKKVEKNWLKLWLTNSTVLERIVRQAIHGRSEFYRDKIRKRLKLYVKTQSLFDAGRMLKENKFLLISGQPGVGKTTLADILTYEFLAQNYQLLLINKDIEEASEVFEQHREVKQLIYFDDFLGANHLELLTHRSNESALVRFIERVQTSNNKFLILTTRTTILKDARESFEKLNRSNIDLNKKELKLEDYSLEDKGRILYNHLFHSSMKMSYKMRVFSEKNYWRVIRHHNYIPRLIEFFTNPYNLTGIAEANYLNFMLSNLQNPREVWRYSFTGQLHPEDRFLVYALYSFGSQFRYVETDFSFAIPIQCVRDAFDYRANYEIRANGFTRTTDAFNTSMRRLVDGYISSIISKEDSEPKLKFLNPSIKDFLTHYLKESEEEKWKLFESALYIEQLKACFDLIDYDVLGYDGYNTQALRFISLVWKNQDWLRPTAHLERINGMNEENARRCEIISLLFATRLTDEINKVIDGYIATILPHVLFDDINAVCCELMMPIFLEADEESLVRSFVSNNWENVVAALWPHMRNSEDFERIEKLYLSYSKTFYDHGISHTTVGLMREQLATYLDERTYDEISEEADEITSDEELDALKDRVKRMRTSFLARFEMKDSDFDEYFYFNDIDVEENMKKKQRRKPNKVQLATEDSSMKQLMDLKQMEANVDALFSITPALVSPVP